MWRQNKPKWQKQLLVKYVYELGIERSNSCSLQSDVLLRQSVRLQYMQKNCVRKEWNEIAASVILLLLGAELPLMVESFGPLNDIFPFPSILDTGYPVFNLHLANILFDVSFCYLESQFMLSTALLVGRSRDRSPVVSMGIFSVVPPTEPCALRLTQPLKVSTRDFSWGKGGR